MKRSWSRSTEAGGALLSLRILAFAAAAPGLLRRRRLAELAAKLERHGRPKAARLRRRSPRASRRWTA